ncbi:hypothetical protein D8674_004714 [Pyrus ussuriensis x Pyrus communis]|uniref:Uncharacterized protein n=1 Tax=Pyrus ussuriensis x Pyrus communis TaxID=2448454 RepID=A0A5N5FKM9_9ROSA|nr:hypothetical protein D8674_004714 [Pyrus ussuriensis x Pyrus communis]
MLPHETWGHKGETNSHIENWSSYYTGANTNVYETLVGQYSISRAKCRWDGECGDDGCGDGETIVLVVLTMARVMAVKDMVLAAMVVGGNGVKDGGRCGGDGETMENVVMVMVVVAAELVVAVVQKIPNQIEATHVVVVLDARLVVEKKVIIFCMRLQLRYFTSCVHWGMGGILSDQRNFLWFLNLKISCIDQVQVKNRGFAAMIDNSVLTVLCKPSRKSQSFPATMLSKNFESTLHWLRTTKPDALHIVV